MLKNAGAGPDVVDPTQFPGHERRGQDLKNVRINIVISKHCPTYLGECGVRDLQTEAV